VACDRTAEPIACLEKGDRQTAEREASREDHPTNAATGDYDVSQSRGQAPRRE
jgi:hypothetical protein